MNSPSHRPFVRVATSGLLALAASACGGSDTETPNANTTRDVRVEIPAPIDNVYDIVTPEVTIAPGEEKLFCMYLTYDGEDTAIYNLEVLQGEGGHHVALLSTREPKPDDTFEDCSTLEDMRNLDPYILPTIELPDRTGISLPKGRQFVLQFHYVNPFPQPILVRDVARLYKRSVDEIDDWIAPFVTNAYDFMVPADEASYKVEFDCTLPFDVELMLIAGHMHEQGENFEVQVGDGTDMSSVYLVDPWKPDFRDAPPVSLFFSNPLTLTQGSILKTTCTWHNQKGRELIFPEEMCTAFGYARGFKDPYVCGDNQ